MAVVIEGDTEQQCIQQLRAGLQRGDGVGGQRYDRSQRYAWADRQCSLGFPCARITAYF
jgi:hypothetical protein